MAKRPFISVDGITVGEANALVNVILANGDITTSNITIGNNANLGNVGNIIITGGSSGYVLSTNGSGNLSWVAQSNGGGSTSNISNGNSNVNIATENGNITMSAVGNANIVVVTGTGATISGLLSVTGNIIPTANITYDLGNNTNRFRDLYLSGNTINLGDSIVSSNANTVTITNQLGGEFIVGGNGIVNSADLTGYSIANGNSNVSVISNGNVTISAVGNANILTVTGTGANITGTLNVTGNATVGNIITGAGSGGNITGANVIAANTVTASGNITASNANLGNAVTANFFIGSGANLTSIAGANISGQVGNALIAGTVYTNAQPNITSVGTLTSLNVSGTGSFGANVNLNSFNITNLATPVASTDAATKQYVDDVAQGLNVHDSVAAATPDTLANVTSGTITYNNGSSGVGANLTTTGSFNLIDGVNVQTAGTRILVKNEANAVFNGIYTWSNATVITRATDYNTVPEVEAGDFVFCTGGTLYDNTGWVQTSTVTAIGTTGNNIEFTQFSGAGTYQAGTGLTLTGSTFSVNASQTQVTSVGTLGNLTVSGNATVGNLVTSGSGGTLSNINVVSANTFTASGNITAGNANLGNSVTANFFTGTLYGTANLATFATTANAVAGANVSGQVGNALVAGTVYTAAQPNITSVGTLTGLTSTGTVNLTGASNVSLGPVGNVKITGGSSGQYLQTDGTGTLNWVSISSSATLANGNSNVNIPSANGNINLTATGNTTLIITDTGANIAGYATITGNLSAGNITTGAGSGGNITGANVISANIVTATLSANLGNSVTANFFIGSGANLTSIPAGNISGQVANALIASTVYTNAQPNITSTGTLVNLTVSGNVALSGANVSLGAVGNVKITGGTANYVLQTDGSGNLSWVAQSGGGSISNISNGNSNVNIPSSNGNINLTAVGNTVMVVTGTGVNVAGTLNVTGNATVGNLVTSGSGGNVSNVNVISANTFIASGNITANNINTTGSGGNIGNANVISANTFVASGNITSGNANLGNSVTANYFTGNFYGTANSATSATTAGTVTTNAQPNITSVGTLTGLTSTGTINLTGASNVSLGPVGNVKITGGTTGQYLQTDGSGTLTWATVSSGSTSNISNGNSNVNIPSSNGNINLTAVGNTVMVVTGTGVNIAGTLNVTGNATVGNLFSSGSGGNISNVNVISANTFVASGNVTAGNIVTSGSGGNISNANVISANTLTASGNINGADLSLSGNGVFGGNLTVNGTLTYINSTTLSISDPIINLQTGANGAAPTANSGKDVGTALNYYDTSAKIAWMGWDVSNAEIAFGSNVGISSEVVTFTSLANIRSGNASLGNAASANYFIGNFYGTANSATTAGTVYTNAQPNITTVGSLLGLTVSNATGVVNFTTTANIALGPVSNVHITGGSNGQYLQTDGSGNLSWSTVSTNPSNISNGNSNVSISTANGNITMSAVGNANIVTVTGTGANISGTLNTTGNVTFTGSNISLGNVGNVRITGGTANYVLSTDGAGNLDWVAQSGGASSAAAVGYSLIFGG